MLQWTKSYGKRLMKKKSVWARIVLCIVWNTYIPTIRWISVWRIVEENDVDEDDDDALLCTAGDEAENAVDAEDADEEDWEENRIWGKWLRNCSGILKENFVLRETQLGKV